MFCDGATFKSFASSLADRAVFYCGRMAMGAKNLSGQQVISTMFALREKCCLCFSHIGQSDSSFRVIVAFHVCRTLVAHVNSKTIPSSLPISIPKSAQTPACYLSPVSLCSFWHGRQLTYPWHPPGCRSFPGLT